MKDIIIAYPVKETAMQLRSLLEKEGFHVSHVCARGSSVLGIAQNLNEGIIVSLQKTCLSDLMLLLFQKTAFPNIWAIW